MRRFRRSVREICKDKILEGDEEKEKKEKKKKRKKRRRRKKEV